MSATIQLRRGTAAQWTASNPVLAAGEPAFESDTGKFKIGNGSSTWTSLGYAGGSNEFDTAIIFEGATANAFETTLTVVDPTADRTITLPNTTGTVITSGDTGTVTATMLANTAVTPGSYTTANITVDAQGRITSASTGTAAQPVDDDQNILANAVFT